MQNPGMQNSTSGAGNASVQAAHSGIDRAASSAHQTVDRVAGAALSTKDRLLATGEQWYAQSQRGVEYTREHVRSHPLLAIGVAVGIGLIVGRLLSRN